MRAKVKSAGFDDSVLKPLPERLVQADDAVETIVLLMSRLNAVSKLNLLPRSLRLGNIGTGIRMAVFRMGMTACTLCFGRAALRARRSPFVNRRRVTAPAPVQQVQTLAAKGNRAVGRKEQEGGKLTDH